MAERTDYKKRLDIVLRSIQIDDAEKGRSRSDVQLNLLTERISKECDSLGIPTASLEQVLYEASRAREGITVKTVDAAALTMRESRRATVEEVEKDYWVGEMHNVKGAMLQEVGAFCHRMNVYDKFVRCSEQVYDKESGLHNWRYTGNRKKLFSWCRAHGFAFSAYITERYRMITDRFLRGDFSRGDDMTKEQYNRLTGDMRLMTVAYATIDNFATKGVQHV